MTDVVDTIGRRLRAARESKGVSLEDAAFETRIHASHLRGLESDDYSAFASATYAKSFLTLYSRYLGVDASEALRFFEGAEGTRLAGAAVLPTLSSAVSISAREAKRAARPVPVRTESPGFAPVLLGLLVLGLVAGIPLLWFLGKDAESLDEVTTKAKALAEAATRQEGVLTSSASPAAATIAAVSPASATPPLAAAPASAPVPAPATPPAPAAEGRPGRRSVAADWVLDASPEPAASPGPVARPAATPAAPDPAPAPTLAAADPPGRAPGLSNLAPGPLRAVPSRPESTDTRASAPGTEPSRAGDEGVRPLPTGPATAIHASPIATADLPAEAATPPQTPSPTPAEKPPVAGPSAGPASSQPAIRATPLIAVPVAIPSETATETGDGADADADAGAEARPAGDASRGMPTAGRQSGSEAGDPAGSQEPGFVDPKNRFPRPLNP